MRPRGSCVGAIRLRGSQSDRTAAQTGTGSDDASEHDSAVDQGGSDLNELAQWGPLSAAELAKAASEPRPSVYRIVAALEQIEAVRPAGDNRFELGTAVLRWSDAAVESFVNRDGLGKQMVGT